MNRRIKNKKNIPRPKRYTIGELVPYWYENYKRNKHSPTTTQVQLVYIKLHIVPQLGSYYLHQLKTIDVQKFINFLSKEGNRSKLKYSSNFGKPLSAWTIKKIRALLLAAMNAAVREGLIEKNPVIDTEAIPVPTIKMGYFTPTQQKEFLDGTQKFRFHIAYQMLFYTGCRRSEILGLSWDHVDFTNAVIHIQQVLVSIDGIPFLKSYPKTKSSVRTIPLHPHLNKILQSHKKKQDQEKKNCLNWNNKNNLVFVNIDGSPHNPTYFLHNFKNAIRKLNLPANLHVHSTRHTFATNLLQLGVAISDIQHLGGWSDTRILLEIYAHSVQNSHRLAIKKLFENNTNKK